jgi:hypothetical protein
MAIPSWDKRPAPTFRDWTASNLIGESVVRKPSRLSARHHMQFVTIPGVDRELEMGVTAYKLLELGSFLRICSNFSTSATTLPD